jgi:hypothetical protein
VVHINLAFRHCAAAIEAKLARLSFAADCGPQKSKTISRPTPQLRDFCCNAAKMLRKKIAPLIRGR